MLHAARRTASASSGLARTRVAPRRAKAPEPTVSLEVCMTDLCGRTPSTSCATRASCFARHHGSLGHRGRLPEYGRGRLRVRAVRLLHERPVRRRGVLHRPITPEAGFRTAPKSRTPTCRFPSPTPAARAQGGQDVRAPGALARGVYGRTARGRRGHPPRALARVQARAGEPTGDRRLGARRLLLHLWRRRAVRAGARPPRRAPPRSPGARRRLGQVRVTRRRPNARRCVRARPRPRGRPRSPAPAAGRWLRSRVDAAARAEGEPPAGAAAASARADERLRRVLTLILFNPPGDHVQRRGARGGFRARRERREAHRGWRPALHRQLRAGRHRGGPGSPSAGLERFLVRGPRRGDQALALLALGAPARAPAGRGEVQHGHRHFVHARLALGASFDCASPTEVDKVMSLGVSPDRVIYAKTCKLPRHLAAVSASGVGMTTFDSAGELAKIAALAPNMRVLLRLRADDPDARCVLGGKYGAEPAGEPLLLAAKALGVKVAGCAFHVGSGATNPLAFREALEFARLAFDTAARTGSPRWMCWTSAAGSPAPSPRAGVQRQRRDAHRRRRRSQSASASSPPPTACGSSPSRGATSPRRASRWRADLLAKDPVRVRGLARAGRGLAPVLCHRRIHHRR